MKSRMRDDLFIFESNSKRIFREGETAGVEEESSRSLDLSFSLSEPRADGVQVLLINKVNHAAAL